MLSIHRRLLFVEVPLSISIPAFCEGVLVSSELSTIILSPILTVLELIIVCVPLTVRLPAITTVSVVALPKVTLPFTDKFPPTEAAPVTVNASPIVTLLGSPTCI